MDFQFTPQQETFRQDIRKFLATELRNGAFRPVNYAASSREAFSRPFSRLVAQKGWIGLAWPKEHGGAGRSFVDQLVYTDEMVFGGAPVACHWLAERQVGPALMASGTPDQQKEFLPPIMAGEMAFCLGISEPGAGSDMASMQTQARDEGNYFVINGQKTFNGGADMADYVFLVARTGAPDSRHRGLSTLLVSLKSPGVTVHALPTVFGARPLSHIFFDGVRLPRRYLLGQKDKGWLIATTQLNFDRSAIEIVAACRRVLRDVVDFVQQRRDGPALPQIRQRLGDLAVSIEVGQWLSYRVAWLQSQGLSPEVETSIAKVFNSELMQQVANEGMRILGLYGNLMIDSKWAALNGWLADWCPTTLGRRVASGTSEIQRNIIAQRGLGLPRG